MQQRLEIDQDELVVEHVVYRYGRTICDALNRMAIESVRKLVAETPCEIRPAAARYVSPTRRQAAETLRRARRLPVGPDRNDLRQLAIGLLWLDKKGLSAKPPHHLRAVRGEASHFGSVDRARGRPLDQIFG